MTRAVVALGSNLGERRSHLERAIGALADLGEVLAVSSLYESDPVGGPDQPGYLNAVAIVETDLSAADLLPRLLAIEQQAGRRRSVRWGPRTLDLDLILHGDTQLASEALHVPHPRLGERRFVLEPLVEVWPEATTPDGTRAADLLPAVESQRVRRVGEWRPGASPRPGRWAGAGFAGRGGWWVVGQGALLVAGAVALFAGSGTLAVGGSWHLWTGRLLVAAGVLQGVAGLLTLGPSLTPYPEPAAAGRLVERGIYRHVRHPIYGGIAMGLTGAALHAASVPGLLLAGAIGVFFWAKAGFEERRLIDRYPTYPAYRERTRARIIPWLL